jgi:membrane protein DedA with SNARE-associated domain/rhodanese-related sulfurtransferase
MPNLIDMLQTYGVLIVFAIVLVEQIGLPIPAFPILIVAGALAVGGDISWPAALAVAVGACLISDFFWFRAGRLYGNRILRLLCKISLSPDYCVTQTEDKFNRYGPKSLVVSKFIPGFNIIASPMSGALGISTGRFLLFSMSGSLLWSGTGLAIGAYFYKSVDQVLLMLEDMGSTALIVLLSLLALFVAFKYVERRNFRRGMEVERISMLELADMIEAGQEPLIVDARSVTAQQLERPIPGALLYNASEASALMAGIPKDRQIVVYCSCPNDQTAAFVAKQLLANGYRRARPLHGGLDAWKSHQQQRDTPADDPVAAA